MLEEFDINALEDPEFKEDSVREEIIAPILRKLGYTPSGSNKIVRSRNLSHPFVSIGSKQNKISIIPDYVLEVDEVPRAIIDAKSPQTSLEQSKHAEQAYSYAIHPEIRAKIYSLCNGKEWIIWDVDKFEPVLKTTITEIVNNSSHLERYLEPKAIEYPAKRDFFPDLGLRMKKMGINEGVQMHYPVNEIGNIMRVEDNLYTINVSVEYGGERFAISFDLSKQLYLGLLQMFPEKTRELIADGLTRQPYNVGNFEPILVSIIGELGSLQEGVFEEFVPVVVTGIKPLNSQ